MFLETDGFLTELTKMYERQKASGTVWVTLKRSSMKRLPKRGKEGVPSPETILDPAGTGGWCWRARRMARRNPTAVPLAKARAVQQVHDAHPEGAHGRAQGDGEEEQEGAGGGKKKA